MDSSGTPSVPAEGKDDGVESSVTKHPASEEPNTTYDAKRVKVSHDWVAETGVQPPNATARPRVPFPDKVRSVSFECDVREHTY